MSRLRDKNHSNTLIVITFYNSLFTLSINNKKYVKNRYRVRIIEHFFSNFTFTIFLFVYAHKIEVFSAFYLTNTNSKNEVVDS